MLSDLRHTIKLLSPHYGHLLIQLVGVFCKGLLPGLLPLVWSIAVLKVQRCSMYIKL